MQVRLVDLRGSYSVLVCQGVCLSKVQGLWEWFHKS